MEPEYKFGLTLALILALVVLGGGGISYACETRALDCRRAVYEMCKGAGRDECGATAIQTCEGSAHR